MSVEDTKSEEGGENEAVNPEQGDSEFGAEPDEESAYDAAESNAIEELDSTVEDETTEEEVIEEPEAESPPQAEDDQADPEPPVEEEVAESKPAWDGNPETLPEELKPTLSAMQKGFHAKMRAVDAELKRTQELSAKLTLKLSGEGQAEAEEGPPPLPTGDDITQEQWNAAVTKQNQWYGEQNRKALLEELKSSGQFAPAERVQQLEAQTAVATLQSELMALPGFTDQHALMMKESLETNPFWQRAYAEMPREAAFELADRVMQKAQSSQTQRAQAQKAEAKTKKQMAASKQATPRITNASGAPEDVFRRTFADEDEKYEYAEKLALEE